jgi:L-lysine exporter family protein LysE/ArgO
MTQHFLTGFLTSAALIVAIGGQNAYVLRQGLRGEHALPLALFCSGTDAVLIFAGIAGLGALISNDPLVLELVRYAGAAFLFWYALAAARRALRGEALAMADAEAVTLGKALLTCAAFTFLNPHVYLDTVVLLGSLGSQQGEGRWEFGAGAALASVTWFLLLAYGARLLVPLFAKPLAWRILDSAIAVLMFSLGLALLLG